MPRHRPFLWLFLGAFAGVPATAGEAEIARVKREFPEALRRLERAFGEVKAVGVLHTDSKGKSWAERTTFAKQGELRKAVSHRLDAEGKRVGTGEGVICFSPEESFEANRRSEDAPYVLSDVQHPGSPELIGSLLNRHVLALYSIYDVPFSRMMEDPSFKIQAVEPAGEGGRDLKITYQYYHKVTFVGDGWVEVAPDLGWAIRKSWNGSGRPAKAAIASSVEYEPGGSGGIPRPRRVTYDLPGGWHEVCDFESMAFEPTPEREFSPTFYGLPDFAGLARDPASNSAAAWLFSLAGVALIVAVGMKVMAARLARQGTAA